MKFRRSTSTSASARGRIVAKACTSTRLIPDNCCAWVWRRARCAAGAPPSRPDRGASTLSAANRLHDRERPGASIDDIMVTIELPETVLSHDYWTTPPEPRRLRPQRLHPLRADTNAMMSAHDVAASCAGAYRQSAISFRRRAILK